MRNFLFLSSILLLLSINVNGQEEKLKANYIFNIVKYINWPESYQTGDFVIGVLGSSKVTTELRKIATTKKVSSQNISVIEFNSTADISKCNVLFITDLSSGLIKVVVAKLGYSPTLIIGESRGLATMGAGINFVVKGDALGFEINEISIKQKGLQVDSKLKGLAL
jgi:hypothetical protein